VAQGVGFDFKPQYWKKKKEEEKPCWSGNDEIKRNQPKGLFSLLTTWIVFRMITLA
jgi:hypothetical protein